MDACDAYCTPYSGLGSLLSRVQKPVGHPQANIGDHAAAGSGERLTPIGLVWPKNRTEIAPAEDAGPIM